MSSEKKKRYDTHNATKQEISAALMLIELLYLQGEIPKHVYKNIYSEYHGKGLDIARDARYTITTENKEVG